jgi:hypothetical protein
MKRLASYRQVKKHSVFKGLRIRKPFFHAVSQVKNKLLDIYLILLAIA